MPVDVLGRCAIAQERPIDTKRSDFRKWCSDAFFVQIHTDGGVEKAGASASATMAVWAKVGDEMKGTIICAKAFLLPPDVTPFYAEACALLEALRDLRTYFVNRPN